LPFGFTAGYETAVFIPAHHYQYGAQAAAAAAAVAVQTDGALADRRVARLPGCTLARYCST